LALLPLWIKEVELSQRALDPLGLSRVSDYITNELLPGITTTTTKGRNYSFYCWAIYQTNKDLVRNNLEFYQKVAKLESAYVIGSLLDAQENFPGLRGGPIGNDKGKRKIDQSKDGIVNINFSVLNHLGGGYGQYYKNAMNLLGLTINLQNRDILTPEGEQLAKLFLNNIETTEYYTDYLSTDDIPLSILKAYGEKASYLRLKETEDEKVKLCKILFDSNKNISENLKSRKSTLLIILKLYDLGIDITDDTYREIIYFGELNDSKTIGFSSNEELVISQWRFLQFHEFFIISLEKILEVFINFIEECEAGASVSQFLEKTSGFIYELESFFDNDLKNLTIEEFFEFMLKNKGISLPFGFKSSELFDEKIRLDDTYSEFKICADLFRCDDPNKIIGLSIALLCITSLRYRHYMDAFDESIAWIKAKNYEEFTLDTFLLDLSSKISQINLKDFLNYMLGNVIRQHDLIALNKLNTGNDTYRFMQKGNIFYFKKEYSYFRRNDRFNTVSSLFADLGLIEQSNRGLCITSFGKNTLKRYS
jgi:hypothetical protein